MSVCITAAEVQEGFLAAQPLIAREILDLTVKTPNWLANVYDLDVWPHGEGTQMQHLIFRGVMPEIERGFEKWRTIENVQGCEPCDGPDCNYNWTPFGGYGLERKVTTLMSRDFYSPEYCVNEIQTTAHFEQVFEQIVRNLYRQTDFFKSMNIGQNVLTSLAKKFVVDSEGPKCNVNNPYVYRPVGANRLSTLNIILLEFFYEQMSRIPDVIPYDVVDGEPVYGLMAGRQLLGHLYRDDPNLRQDVRFSGYANDLVTMYNFMGTIRGMFIAAPIRYPRRFNIDGSGNPVEVLPFVNGAPAELGTYTVQNQAYESATHEEVILHGKHPFKLYYLPTVESLGGGTSFGPEESFMNVWNWINPPTKEDPGRRSGYFWTSMKMGVAQQYSEGIFGILVERPSVTLTAMYTPNPVCPEEPPTCTNVVPDVECPCPIVLDIQPHPLIPGDYFFTFASVIEGEATDEIVFEYDNGTTLTGEVVEISTDGTVVQVTLTDDIGSPANCSGIIGVACATSGYCSASVQSTNDCRSDQLDAVSLLLDRPLVAVTALDVVTATFGDCSVLDMQIVSVDAPNLTWVVQYIPDTSGPTDDPTGAGATVLTADLVCDRGGISKLCVPPATDASCPECDASVTNDCTYDLSPA